jgi:hypothetical protein
MNRTLQVEGRHALDGEGKTRVENHLELSLSEDLMVKKATIIFLTLAKSPVN